MKNIQISLGRHSYQYRVTIGAQILTQGFHDLLCHIEENRIFVVTNEVVEGLYPSLIEESLPDRFEVKKLVLPDGEQHKNLASFSTIIDFLVTEGANRKSVLIAFGGGVIGDMTGFAAASFMRGIPYIQVPSTLLSQVDSSIGGKTAVNHLQGKNVIGAFKQPLGTLIDVDLLKTLPNREFVAGYGELIKHGFIADTYLYQLLKTHSFDKLQSDQLLLIEAITRSCQVKANVVEQDELEAFQRALLNFGHTLGHMIETYTNYSQVLHGEAVLVGMDFAAFWSWKEGHLGEKEFQAVHQHLAQTGVTVELNQIDQDRFFELVGHDKKSNAQGVNFVCLHAIGQAGIVEKVSLQNLWDAFEAYRSMGTALIQPKG